MDDPKLDFLWHHVFLPTQVPSRGDMQSGLGDQALVDALLESVKDFRDLNDHQYYQHWSTIQRCLRTFALLHTKSKSISQNALKSALKGVSHGDVIILYVALQNSGVIIQKKGTEYVIETFEASPRSADILAATGALEWDFPSRAVAIPAATFEDSSLQESLADYVEKASLEPVKQYAATASKAGSNAYESRDTPFPAILGQLFPSILEAVGRNHTPVLTRKSIHDEVCWSDGAECPWRRSATWLILRVGIQRILCSLLGSQGIFQYKFFMGFLISTLCRSFCAQTSFPRERLAFARAKLARRVAKLESQGASGDPDAALIVQSLFSRYESTFTNTLQIIGKTLDDAGNRLRMHHTKNIQRLPKRADAESTILSLHHSRATLDRILTEVFYGQSRAKLRLPQRQCRMKQYDNWIKTQFQDHLSATDYHCLADMELRLASEVRLAMMPGLLSDSEENIVDLRKQLRVFQSRALRAYRENVELSSLMLLTLMEIWVAIDSLATKLFPLLLEYDPGFPDDIMYPLKLAKLVDMERLSKVEFYLQMRRANAMQHVSGIFGTFSKTSFAVRYFDRCNSMQALLADIWAANDTAKLRKGGELEKKSKVYQNLVKEAAETTCLYVEDEFNPLKRMHDNRRCRKHYLERRCARMRIGIHEDFLPSDDMEAKAVVFELLLPPGYAAWRDSTWQLLTLSRHGKIIPDQKPKLVLRDYPNLEKYAKDRQGSITLASRTKSFHDTHYASAPFPAQLDQICLAHGLKYGVYDCEHEQWTSRHLEKPSFAGICCPDLTNASPWASLQRYIHPTFNDIPPSENEVIASQTRCPNNLTVAEYTVFQDLRIGTRIQWLKILRELVSSDINFGSIEITTLVTELALGAGPSEDGKTLRAAHWIFRNKAFCHALATHVEARLRAIETNWREGQTVECLLILVQRLWELSSFEGFTKGHDLLLYIRKLTHKWIRLLRREICAAVDVETAQKRSRESLHAALLCRKTFMIEASTSDVGFTRPAFACFLECAFTIKDNLSLSDTSYIEKMAPALRKLYISDLKLIHNLESQIRQSVQTLQSAVTEAVNSVWMESEGPSARTYSKWTILASSHDSWVTAKAFGSGSNGISTSEISEMEQNVHFDMFEGTLYVDGQLLGRLPDDFSREKFFQQFFGDRIFLTRPSYLHGMSYMIATPVEDHEIHFGFRDGVRFMRVRPRNKAYAILEYLPPTVFLGSLSTEVPDLPMPLIDNCVHWLNLQTASVEIRPRISMWRGKLSDWLIDCRTRQGIRRASLLVDPRSHLFDRIATVIEPFEYRKSMTIFQPEKSNVIVNLPNLELAFRVRGDGLLHSRQLRAYIDINQDAGTLYGLRSSLVLCDDDLPENRSILVTMGTPSIERSESHVNVSIQHTGYYARFTINRLLGRLECAPEPRLIYFRVYCHAVTSSVHPDTLTGRTGTEEALSCLRAANAQPWAPLDPTSYEILFMIADLTPARIYYPENLRSLQSVLWDDKIMARSQHGDFRPIVEDILQQCNALHRFHLDSGSTPLYTRKGDSHLLDRALTRSHDFEPIHRQVVFGHPTANHYKPRDSVKSPGHKNAYEAASLTWQWSRNISICPDLAARMQELSLIQGFKDDLDLHLLSSLLNFDPAAHWGSTFALCAQRQNQRDKPKLMFMFGTMAFGGQADMTLIRSLIAICVMDESTELKLPQCAEFVRFRRDQIPTIETLAQYIRPHKIPYPDDERTLIGVTMHSKQRRKLEMAQIKYEEDGENNAETLASHLLSQWPERELSVGNITDLPLLDVQGALISVRPEWERLSDNFELSHHLVRVQSLLDTCKAPVQAEKPKDIEKAQEWYRNWKLGTVRLRMEDLLNQPLKATPVANGFVSVNSAPHSAHSNPHGNVGISGEDLMLRYGRFIKPSLTAPKPPVNSSTIISELQTIVGQFSASTDHVRAAYGKLYRTIPFGITLMDCLIGQDLQVSLTALQRKTKAKSSGSSIQMSQFDIITLNQEILGAREELGVQWISLRNSLIQSHKWHRLGGLVPIVTPITLLETLQEGGNEELKSASWLNILRYAEAMVGLQHLLRIREAHRRNHVIQLRGEINNLPHIGWKPQDHIDWLLLEIDFNLIIRCDQLQVAKAMIASPRTASNFVLQMNMGQGKSSVIIPMVATALANDRNLVRVVVPRSLLLHAASLLCSRLGGLINRRIKHIPFSRKSPTDIESIKAYHNLHLDVYNGHGVLLALPEHLLSFHLSGLQELSNGRVSESTYMIKLQAWFSRKARDILDECDHMLAVKTQLIYPSGAQSPVDGHPIRWESVQILLKLAKTHIKQLCRELPRSLELINRSSGAFPTVYFLDQHVKDRFLARLTDSILRGDGGLLPVRECSQDELACTADFLNHAQFAKSSAAKVAQVFKAKKDTRHQILLLRGLLVHKILLMGLSKRWNVQYGIHPLRDPIAVPFRSKGLPSDQAEFGHPDVSILLTCLSFYNSGLSLTQFRENLGLLLKSEEPVREFESWMSEVKNFPESLRSWNSINVDDQTQCAALWEHLRFQMAVINFFLNHFVFPRHAKTFDRKLVSSATKATVEKDLKENLPGLIAKRNIGGVPTALTVGFSGTNDNKTLLPLNVLQSDLPSLVHTNAEVLTYLLQPRNRLYVRASDMGGRRLSERAFLKMLKERNIRMLLDAGAQILELDNISLARVWLGVDTEAEAAVYFGEDERARVVYRDGKVQPLAASPYLDNLDACVVYLDEAHTRGVDLKMPAFATAALTLGVMQTKDHTVQAAMRLRQLAISQSVVFFAPPEVHQSILNSRSKGCRGFIDSYDVIVWLLEQTCCSIEQLQPLYVSQGMEFCRRRLAAQKYKDSGYSEDEIKAYLKVLEQPEKYSLQELYAPDRRIKASKLDARGSPEIAGYVEKLNVLKNEIRNTGDTVQALAHQEVEQEREVQIEVETVRELKKPHHAQPLAQNQLHRDVRSFADTGRLVAGSHVYLQAFVALRHTAVGRRRGISDSATRSGLYISYDFSITVVPDPLAAPRDEYSRPVHWVLWSNVTATALILTDNEANALIPLIRDISPPIVHLISYAAPVTKAMIIFDNLDLFSIPQLPKNWVAPEWLVVDLGIFAGRTYFDYDKQYPAVCEALGLPIPPPRTADLDREMPFGDEGEWARQPFSPFPLLFMQEWLAVRRKGQDFSQTMMGEICRGRKLDKPDAKELEDADGPAEELLEVEEEAIEEQDIDEIE